MCVCVCVCVLADVHPIVMDFVWNSKESLSLSLSLSLSELGGARNDENRAQQA